jgi:hypothetical protein
VICFLKFFLSATNHVHEGTLPRHCPWTIEQTIGRTVPHNVPPTCGYYAPRVRLALPSPKGQA